MGASKVRRRRALRFLVGEFDHLAERRGLKTDADKARFLRIDGSIYHRVTRGQVHVSDQFVAAVLAAFPEAEVTFERLFVVEEVAP